MIPCAICGRGLKSQESIARGVGPVCGQKLSAKLSAEKLLCSEIPDQQIRTSKELELTVAKHIEKMMVAFNQKFGENGEFGEIDAATKEAIIEVTTRRKGKFTQTTEVFRSLLLNPEQKSVVLYAPNYNEEPKKKVSHHGVRCVRNLEELDAALRSIKKWRQKFMDQAILLTKEEMSIAKFEEVMTRTGGQKLEDGRFFFHVGESRLWVSVDPGTLEEYEEEEMERVSKKLGAKASGCLNIQFGHSLSLEEARPLWARWVYEFDAVLDLEDGDMMAREDLYNPGN